MKRAQILAAIQKVSKSANKTQSLRILGIPRATYYSWLRTLKTKGPSGIVSSEEMAWTPEDVKKLRQAFCSSSKVSLSRLTQIFPKRTLKAVEAKLSEIGLSVMQHNRRVAREAGTKRCAKCKAQKPKAEYYPATFESLDGLHVWCKSCVLQSQAKYRLVNRSAIRKREAKRRERLRLNDPHYSSETNKLWRRTAKGAFNTLRQRHENKTRRRVASFDISEAEFTQWFEKHRQSCIYCGLSLDEYLSIRHQLPGAAKRANVMTIDRLDSNKPYSVGNLGFACYLCNSLKGYVFSEREFRQIAKKFIRPRMIAYMRSFSHSESA